MGQHYKLRMENFLLGVSTKIISGKSVDVIHRKIPDDDKPDGNEFGKIESPVQFLIQQVNHTIGNDEAN